MFGRNHVYLAPTMNSIQRLMTDCYSDLRWLFRI